MHARQTGNNQDNPRRRRSSLPSSGRNHPQTPPSRASDPARRHLRAATCVSARCVCVFVNAAAHLCTKPDGVEVVAVLHNNIHCA